MGADNLYGVGEQTTREISRAKIVQKRNGKKKREKKQKKHNKKTNKETQAGERERTTKDKKKEETQENRKHDRETKKEKRNIFPFRGNSVFSAYFLIAVVDVDCA